jgi:hypothetical protein
VNEGCELGQEGDTGRHLYTKYESPKGGTESDVMAFPASFVNDRETSQRSRGVVNPRYAVSPGCQRISP